MAAGYSKTPLAKKLGIKSGMTVQLINAPGNIMETLAPLPEGVIFIGETEHKTTLPFIHFFTKDSAELEAALPDLKTRLASDGTLWISWPKKASKVPTDLSGAIVREMGLASGLVDVKVCAVDDIWSGHKFVYRLKDRK